MFIENVFVINPGRFDETQEKTSGFSSRPRKNKEEKGQYYALAIGFCVVSGAYGAGVLSGGAFNPAVAFALDVTSTLGPIFSVGEGFMDNGELQYPVGSVYDIYIYKYLPTLYLPTFG